MADKKLMDLLGTDAEALLSYQAKGFSKDKLHLPGPDFVDRVLAPYLSRQAKAKTHA